MTKRIVKYFLLVVLLVYAGWYTARTMPDQRRTPLMPLEVQLAPELQVGWRVARPPDLPGPYRREGRSNHTRRGEIGKVQVVTPTGPTVVNLGRDDAEQMAIVLTTADDRVTVVLLER